MKKTAKNNFLIQTESYTSNNVQFHDWRMCVFLASNDNDTFQLHTTCESAQNTTTVLYYYTWHNNNNNNNYNNYYYYHDYH